VEYSQLPPTFESPGLYISTFCN